MSTTRLMNAPADYERLGVSPDGVEPWEDGRRDDGRPGAFEWWYFDAILDDGTKLVVVFFDKHTMDIDRPTTPFVEIGVTLPTGEELREYFEYSEDEASFSTEQCDVRFGPHSFAGDLKRYEIEVIPVNGLGAKLVLESRATPWRPGTGYIGFGDNDEDYFTWLCSVPRGRVHGQLTVDGETRDIAGYGYHDHQWGSVHPLLIWNHWFWIRQAFGDYTVLVFDLVANADHALARYPFAFIQDKDGKVVFESSGNAEDTGFTVDSEYEQAATGKRMPQSFTYTFGSGDSSMIYALQTAEELQAHDTYSVVPEPVRAQFDEAKIRPSYTRWAGNGRMALDLDGVPSTHEGEAIFEMIFSGTRYQFNAE